MSCWRVAACGMALAMAAATPTAFGAPTLAEIPPVRPAISSVPSGIVVSPTTGDAIVIGNNTPVGGNGVYGGFIWDATNGVRQFVSTDNAGSEGLYGIGYRTTGGQPQLVINGKSAGFITDWYSNTDGTSWFKKRRDTWWPTSNTSPLFVDRNSLGANLDGSAYYTICTLNSTTIMSLECDDSGGDPPGVLVSRDQKGTTQAATVRAASGTGLSVGSRRNDSNQDRVYVYQHTGLGVLPANGTQDVAFLTALGDPELGQAWAISQVGNKVFGMSPVLGGRTGNWPFVMTVTVTPNEANPGHFIIGQTAAQELPTYPDTAGSSTNALPYAASYDGSFAAGMNYRGQERAVLWDLRDAEPTNWKVYDLTAYLGASGNLGPFTRLSRAYGVAASDTEVVVTGIGVLPYWEVTATNVQINDVFRLTVGPSGNQTVISYTAALATVADVSAGLTAAWNASTDPLCTPFTATDGVGYLTLTADVPGTPFPAIATSTTNGGANNNQTLSLSATRGWSLTIPLADLPLPDTGACCMIGSCTSKFATDCPDVAGQQSWSANTLCANAGCPGACCDPMTGACGDFVEQATCESSGGTYRGNSSACATSSCLGSCCKTDGTCGNEPPGYCTSISGIAGALGSTCGATTCIGACCQGQQGCEEVAYGLCPQDDFKGIGTACAQQTCPCSSSVNVWADHDVDGDVDMDDFGQFQRCFAGTDNVVGAGCECLNKVNDGTIDGADFIEFMNCATGAEVQWTQLLTPDCTP